MEHAAVTGATPTTGLNGRPRRMTDTTGFPRACLVRAENGAATTIFLLMAVARDVAGNSFFVFFTCVSGFVPGSESCRPLIYTEAEMYTKTCPIHLNVQCHAGATVAISARN